MTAEIITITKEVIDAIRDAEVIGIAPRQISLKVGIPKHEVVKKIDDLHKRGKITRIGRNLWILSKYRDIRKAHNFKTPEWYIKKFQDLYGNNLSKYNGKITFGQNGSKRVHRWSPYIQGFSASFVDDIVHKYRISKGMKIADPFLGSGTVPVYLKLHGIDSVGIEIIPLLAFMAKVKTTWDLDVDILLNSADHIVKAVSTSSAVEDFEMPFLTNTKKHFSAPVLEMLLKLRSVIIREDVDDKTRDILRLAFASILIDCSNMWRAPCLAYTDKSISKHEVCTRFIQKIRQMVEDLQYVQKHRKHWGQSEIIEGNAQTYVFEPDSIDAVITSPPYNNGIDYVINYKIEMAWLGFAKSYKDLRNLRNRMVACDNISRATVREFSRSQRILNDEWIDGIVSTMGDNLKRKTISRRPDMHLVVRKYFEDIYPVFENIHSGLKPGGFFIIVIGDSLMSGVYIPTDLILARIGRKVGFNIESIALARKRRSGQRRDFMLRESIVVLKKGMD